MTKQKTSFPDINEKYCSLLFDTSQQCVLVLADQDRIIYANRSAKKFLGDPAVQLAGKELLELVTDQKAIETIKQLLSAPQGDPQPFELELKGPLQPIPALMTLIPFARPGQETAQTIVLLQPGAQPDLAHSLAVHPNESAEITSMRGQIGVWEWDVRNDRMTWDDRMFELYGVAPQKFAPVYASWLKLLLSEDVENSDQAVKKTLLTGNPLDLEFRICVPEVGIRYLKAYGRVFSDAAGHPVRMSGINLDITEQKWVEKANRLMAEAHWQIIHSTDPAEIYQIVGQKIHEIIEDGFVSVTAFNEQHNSIYIKWVYGISDTYKKLVEQFKIDPTSIEFPVSEIDAETLHMYRSGQLEKYTHGLYQLAQKRVPEQICHVIGNMLSIRLIYIMGFVWGMRHYGGVIITPDREIGPVESHIASIVNLAAQALRKLRFETALRESEEKSRELFENSPISLWDEDFSAVKVQLDKLRAKGVHDFTAYFAKHPEQVESCASLIKIRNVNQAAVKLLHAADKNELLQNFQTVFGGSGYPYFTPELVAIAEKAPKFEWEGTNFSLDGKPLTLHLYWEAIPGYEDTLEKVIVSVLDVTDHRRAESQIREKEEKFRTIFEKSPVGIVLSTPQNTMASVNPMFLSMLGYSESELIGQSYRTITYPEDISANEAQIKRLTEGKIPYFSMQKRYLHKEGTVVWANLIVTGVYAENGDLLSLLAIVEDISNRKQAEAAIEYERFLMQALLDNIPDSVYFKDLSSRFIRVNQATIHKFGCTTPDQILGKSDADFFPEEIAREGLDEEQKIIQTGEPIIGSESIENWLDQRPTSWASSTKMPLRDKSGKIIGTFGITRDITDSKLKEEEIKQLNSDLEKKVQARTKELSLRNQELEAFAYSISHDLKAPLRGINGYSQLLVQEHAGQLDEEGKQFLDKLILSSGQLTQLIDDLFAYTRLERRPINHVDFSVSEIIAAVIDERKVEIQKRGIILHPNVEDFVINSSPELFTQIVSNYLDNAIKYTEKVDSPEIWIDFKVQKDTCLLTVRDNGIGFEMKYAEKLFEVFYRLHRLDEYPGTGIGLALAKKAAQLLGFRVWAEGELGKGATFYLEIGKK